MKKRWFLAALCCAMLLSGCSSMLSRSYTTVTPHSATPTAEGDPFTLRVENYQELVNALIYLISQGEETGTLRLYNYEQDVDDALSNACLEVVQEDPLGAYAVDFIRYDVAPILAYYEADVQITYRRTHDQVAAIVAATGATAIRGQLQDLLSSFGAEAALRISYFEGDEAYIRTLFREAYYTAPGTAIELPKAEIHIYPAQTGGSRQRIVEILLTYQLDQTELQRRRTALARKVNDMTLELWGPKEDDAIQAVAAGVLEAGRYDPEGGASAYNALVLGAANSEGLSLAMTLLSQRMSLSCITVVGTLDGQPHVWNVVQTQEGYRHLDLTWDLGEDGMLPFRSDRQLAELGYTWDNQIVPQCGEQPLAEEVSAVIEASTDIQPVG